MKTERPLKPTDSAIRAYYAELEAYSRQGVLHEGAVSSAFENLLRECARRRGWTLIPQLETPGDRRNVPDGTVRDENSLPRGYWEAKDSDDDLKAEIAKKIARGYPVTNMIFEDTRHAVLYQNKQPTPRSGLAPARRTGVPAEPVLYLSRAEHRGVRAGGGRVQRTRSRPRPRPE